MTRIRKAGLLAACALVGSLLLAGQAQAGVSCHQINAKGAGQDLGGGMTVASISGGGLLQGTTAGSFVTTGFSGTVASIAGTVDFTANRATLTVTVTGTFDVASGAFSASGAVTASTGKLAGATGALTLAGSRTSPTAASSRRSSAASASTWRRSSKPGWVPLRRGPAGDVA